MPEVCSVRPRRLLAVAAGLFSAGLALAAGADDGQGVRHQPAPAWNLAILASQRETYDSNVFLQDLPPTTAIAGALPRRRGSLVTTVGASVALDHRLGEQVKIAANYGAEATVYHSAPTESHRLNKLGLVVNGQGAGGAWTFQNLASWIDGSEDGPIFGCTGGAAAMGGIPLRDRRAALVGRSLLKATRQFGAWQFRPVATAYVHNFLTRQSRQAGYLNYIDRQEWVGGVDVGREIGAKNRVFAGFRFGRQDQLKLHGIDSPYDSTLRRFLVGLEGAPQPWLQLNVLTGPEFRRFARGTAAGFDRGRVRWWIDAAGSVTLTPRDVCAVTIRRFEQPAFGSQGMYEDITYEVSWRRKWSSRTTAGVGLKAYGGDWPGPATREDWILTPSLQLRCTLSRRCTLEFSYALDRAESRVPNTAGREYWRHLAGCSAQFSL